MAAFFLRTFSPWLSITITSKPSSSRIRASMVRLSLQLEETTTRQIAADCLTLKKFRVQALACVVAKKHNLKVEL